MKTVSSYVAEVIGIRYEAGSYVLTSGHKASERNHYSESRGYVRQRGFGWASEFKPSKLILDVSIDGKRYEVWVDRFFKEQIGRLTENRKNVIISTVPKMVNVEKHETCSGSIYYTVTEADMQEWLERVLICL